jgi:hypothetical protein
VAQRVGAQEGRGGRDDGAAGAAVSCCPSIYLSCAQIMKTDIRNVAAANQNYIRTVLKQNIVLSIRDDGVCVPHSDNWVFSFLMKIRSAWNPG